MISVAVCTYNGEKYIEKQISSILSQSLAVDEIVVCDDGSTDKTLDIIRDYQSQTTSIIHIHENERQLGVCANFQKAIDLCKGDIIFLSDQDDVWLQNKVETICKWFDKHPTLDVVFTNANLIDDEGIIIQNDSLWKRVGFSRKERLWFNYGFALEVFIRGNVAIGGTMAIRKNKKAFCSIVSSTPIYHDKIIAIDALKDKSLGFISKPLIQYRLHNSQVSGLSNVPLRRTSAISPFWFFSEFDYIPLVPEFELRAQFGEDRLKSKHSWFGLYVFNNLSKYWYIYGIKCGIIAVLNDFYESFIHSLYRIYNKLLRLCKLMNEE